MPIFSCNAHIFGLGILFQSYILDAKTQIPVQPHTSPSDVMIAQLSAPETAQALSASTTQAGQLLFGLFQGFAGSRFNVTAVIQARAVIKARASVGELAELTVPGSLKRVRLSTLMESAWRTFRSENNKSTNLESSERLFRALYLDCLRKGLKTSREDPWSVAPMSERPTALALQRRDGVLFAGLIRAGHTVSECDYLMGVVSYTVVRASFLAKKIHSMAALTRSLDAHDRVASIRDQFEFVFTSISLELERTLRLTTPVLGKILDGEPIVDTEITRRGFFIYTYIYIYICIYVYISFFFFFSFWFCVLSNCFD